MACSVHVQRICKIISTKSSKIVVHENLDPQKFSAIRYIQCCFKDSLCILVVLCCIGYAGEFAIYYYKYTVSYSTVKRISAAICVLQVARFVFTTCSPLTANFHTPATPPKPLSLHPLRPLKNCAHQSENVTYTPHMVSSYIKLQSKQTYGIRTTDIYIYEIHRSTH